VLVDADKFSGEPGYSAPIYEFDYAHRKPRCDVLLNGSAYAPGGRPVKHLTVELRVGAMKKSFDVVGNRVWKAGFPYLYASDPEPFAIMSISYDTAFGGVDKFDEDPAKHRWYPSNHAGVGYSAHVRPKALNDKPLPNTQETGKPISSPQGNYKPMAFGPVGRSWQPRAKHAGTYDAKWFADRAPFWPDDFDYRYFQAAPEDQQIPYPTGGEEVVLTNLTPQGITRFRLPKMRMPVVMIPASGREQLVDTVIDTIVLEPDQERFMLTWRATVPMKRSCFDIVQTIVGEKLRGVRHARRLSDKERFANLGELIRRLRTAGKK
jgi:hypothetical protein